MSHPFLKLLIFKFLLICSLFCFGQSQPLFESKAPLKLEVSFAFKDVFKSRTQRVKTTASIKEVNGNGEEISNTIQVSIRGRSRSKKQICQFPPLRFYFNNTASKGVFINQDELKLITHCDDSYVYENYIKKEYLIYELYNLITPVSVRGRICEITYIDTNNPKNKITKNGIILEDVDHVAKRNNLVVFKRELRSQESINKKNLDRLVFFQYMIGNLDWEIPNQHNIKLMRNAKSGLPVAIPYDFDYSGFVDTDYAVPPESLTIESVKERVFRGFCRRNFYGNTITYYLNKKSEFINTINKADYLPTEERAKTKRFILDFFNILENSTERTIKIAKACRAKHKHVYQK